tara:strand:+ start:4337 stop:4591 length:255 start_codon:yes stop_codon:yes gene_type:complete
MPNFRASINEDELTFIKEGLDFVRHDATDPRKPDFDKVEKIKILSKKIDIMATKFFEYKKKCEEAKVLGDMVNNPAKNSDDESE